MQSEENSVNDAENAQTNDKDVNELQQNFNGAVSSEIVSNSSDKDEYERFLEYMGLVLMVLNSIHSNSEDAELKRQVHLIIQKVKNSIQGIKSIFE